MMNGKKTEPEEPLSRESEPLYRQAAEILRDRILKGEYPPGTMIPSERELGNSLGISRIPIRASVHRNRESGEGEGRCGSEA